MERTHIAEEIFNKKPDTDDVCWSITKSMYGMADRKKVTRDAFQEALKSASYVTMLNLILYLLEMINQAVKEGYTSLDILGEMQLEVVEILNILATCKNGSKLFNRLSIDELLQAKSAYEILLLSAKHPRSLVKRTSK